MMNTAMLTGWLQADAIATYVPGSGARVLVFDVMLANGSEAAPWRCEIVDEMLAKAVEKKLVAGAGVMLRAELRARPFVRDQVTKGMVRFLVVDRVEFSRVPVAATACEPAEI